MGENNKCFCHLNGYEVKDAKARKDIEKLSNKKYLIIGDSMAAREVNWVTYWAESMGITSDDYYNYSKGGYGFRPSDIDGGYQELLQKAVSEIKDPLNITDIIICGTVNDYAFPESDIENSMLVFVNTAKAIFKNAVLKLGLFSGSSIIEDIGGRTGRIAYFYKKLCVKYNIEYLHGSEYIMHDYRFFSSDGIHPKDTNVYKWVGQCVAQATKTGKVSINYVNLDRQLSGANGFSLADGFEPILTEIISDAMASFDCGTDIRLVSDDGVTIASNVNVVMCSLDEGLIKGAHGRYCTTKTPTTILAKLKQNNEIYEISGVLSISNNNIVFNATDKELPSITSEFKATAITIPKFSINSPTAYC